MQNVDSFLSLKASPNTVDSPKEFRIAYCHIELPSLPKVQLVFGDISPQMAVYCLVQNRVIKSRLCFLSFLVPYPSVSMLQMLI